VCALARGFSWQQRITLLHLSRLRITSEPGGWRICLPPGLHAYTSITTDWRSYLPASPRRWATTGSGPTLACHPRRSRRRGDTGGGFGWLVSPAWPGSRTRGYGNINPLSIDYACRPRLRSRLTLGGLAWPRNPWSFGGRVSHSAFATHACILTPAPSTAGSRRGFTGCGTLPYPPTPLDHHPQRGGGRCHPPPPRGVGVCA
jgi:hypothetical protein